MNGGGGVGRRFMQKFILFFLSISLQPIQGLGDDTSKSKDGANAEASSKTPSNTGRVVLLMCLCVGVVLGLSFILFKLWQKKKREEQHAQLLRLFEEDDELDIELGLRD